MIKQLTVKDLLIWLRSAISVLSPSSLTFPPCLPDKKIQQTNSLKVREVDTDRGRDLANQDLSLCKKMQVCVLSVSVITD
jgi:hypothetical protein